MLIDTANLDIINLRKSVLYDFIDPEQFPFEATGLVFRGIGQKELDFIRKHNYIASKGKGNDADQENVTCFSQLFSQAEGYARSQYDLYNEPQGYVIAIERPIGLENELGEIEVVGKVPASSIQFVMPIDQLNKAVKPDKSITRAEAKKVHKDLPEGGAWRTMNGHHVYIKDGKVLAGAVPGLKGAKKATKAQLAEHQANVDKEAKAAKKKTPTKTSKQSKAQKEAAKARKDIDDIANSRPKEPKKKTIKEAMTDSKKATDEALKKPNPKAKPGKSATKKDLDNLVKENEKNKKPAPKPTTKEDLDEMFGTPEAKKPAKKKVADIRTEKQTNNDVAYDVGKKIGGARKDTATKRAIDNLVEKSSGQSLAELEAISPELAQKYCVKKNLLNPVDFEAEYKTGTDINVAMAKQLIFDRIAPKPSGDTPKDREQYLNALKSLQRILEPIKSWDEFKKAIRNLGDHMKRETPKYYKDQLSYLDYAMKEAKREPTDYDLRGHYNYKTKENETWTPEQWKASKEARVKEVMADIEAHKKAAKDPYSPLGEKLTNFFTNSDSRNRTLDTIANKKLDWNNYFKEDKTSEAPKVPKGEKNKVKWERVMPAKIQRAGGRASKVEKPEDMIKHFNFSGVEFGNWVDDKSGNFHMKKCAEAFMDLADIIGVNDKDVSFNGKLSMAFGARGNGFALAHYEPDAKAINITKEGGAGSLAHEWGHALDNMMYQQSTGQRSLNLASNGMGDKGDPAVKAAYKDVLDAMLNGDGVDYVDNKNNSYYSYPKAYKDAVETLGYKEAIKKLSKLLDDRTERDMDYYNNFVRGHYGAETAEKYIKKAQLKANKARNEMVQLVAYLHEKITGEKLDKIPVPTGQSQYYIDSSQQGGKGNKYWTSNEEMFARAFENYIEGKMKLGKVKNDYLVHGTYSSIPGIPAPYPQGAEREKIHKAFDKLLDAIRKSGAIKKAIEIEVLEKSYVRRHAGDFARQVILDTHRERYEYPENPPEIIASATGDYGDAWCQIWSTGMDWNCYYYMLNSKNKEPKLIAMCDNDGDIKPTTKDISVPKDIKRSSNAWQKICEDWVLKRCKKLTKSFENYNRNAYNVADTSEVFFIPVNRLKCPYQTEEALNFDKIRENVERMKAGENLEPVTIGYDYDVHDGHHRIEASKILGYTHIPCRVGGSNDLEVQRAKEAYGEVWRALGLYIDLEKSSSKITREQTKKVHKDLPEGGAWRTMNGTVSRT